MLARQSERLCVERIKIDAALRHRAEADLEKIGRRIGRWLGKYPAAAKVMEVEVERDETTGAAHALGISSPLDKGWRTEQRQGA